MCQRLKLHPKCKTHYEKEIKEIKEKNNYNNHYIVCTTLLHIYTGRSVPKKPSIKFDKGTET